MIDVMFYEVFKEEAAALKKKLPISIKTRYTHKTIQEQKQSIPPSSLICIRTHSRVPPSWAGQLKGVLTRSQGFDHLVEYRRKTGVDLPCGFLGDYCSMAVAEHAIMVMLLLLRKVKRQIKNFESFDRDALTGKECYKRNALVIGVGHIGSAIAELAKAMKMSIKGVDISHRVKDLSYVSLKKGLRWADVIFCALPLTEKANAMLDYQALRNARPGSIFINISRGEISPLKDLHRLLKEKRLGALALDVYEDEDELALTLRSKFKKAGQNFKIIQDLQKQDNVLLTPHNAFNTEESVERKAKQTVESIVYFLKHKVFQRPVPTEKWRKNDSCFLSKKA